MSGLLSRPGAFESKRLNALDEFQVLLAGGRGSSERANILLKELDLDRLVIQYNQAVKLARARAGGHSGAGPRGDGSLDGARTGLLAPDLGGNEGGVDGEGDEGDEGGECDEGDEGEDSEGTDEDMGVRAVKKKASGTRPKKSDRHRRLGPDWAVHDAGIRGRGFAMTSEVCKQLLLLAFELKDTHHKRQWEDLKLWEAQLRLCSSETLEFTRDPSNNLRWLDAQLDQTSEQERQLLVKAQALEQRVARIRRVGATVEAEWLGLLRAQQLEPASTTEAALLGLLRAWQPEPASTTKLRTLMRQEPTRQQKLQQHYAALTAEFHSLALERQSIQSALTSLHGARLAYLARRAYSQHHKQVLLDRREKAKTERSKLVVQLQDAKNSPFPSKRMAKTGKGSMYIRDLLDAIGRLDYEKYKHLMRPAIDWVDDEKVYFSLSLALPLPHTHHVTHFSVCREARFFHWQEHQKCVQGREECGRTHQTRPTWPPQSPNG